MIKRSLSLILSLFLILYSQFGIAKNILIKDIKSLSSNCKKCADKYRYCLFTVVDKYFWINTDDDFKFEKLVCKYNLNTCLVKKKCDYENN